jgi:hypothetical protein
MDTEPHDAKDILSSTRNYALLETAKTKSELRNMYMFTSIHCMCMCPFGSRVGEFKSAARQRADFDMYLCNMRHAYAMLLALSLFPIP